VYCFAAARLCKPSAGAANNDQGEHYLTDVIGILARAGARVDASSHPDPAKRPA